MDLKDAIYNRRSVRFFSNTPVEREKVDLLLQAAIQAPSAMNSQPWAFAVIKDVNLLKELSDRSKKYLLENLDTVPVLAKYKNAFEKPEFNIFYNANCLVIIYAHEVHPGVVVDCSLAAQNLMLTAHSLGLGTCWIGFANTYLDLPEVMAELNVPPDYKVIAPIIVGYPRRTSPSTRNEPKILFEK